MASRTPGGPPPLEFEFGGASVAAGHSSIDPSSGYDVGVDPNSGVGGGAGLSGPQANTAYESALAGGADRLRANSVYAGFGPDTTSTA